MDLKGRKGGGLETHGVSSLRLASLQVAEGLV